MITASSAAPLNPSAALALASLERRMDVCCYDSIRKTARQLFFPARVPAGIDDLNRLAQQLHPPVTIAGGKRLRFVVQESGAATRNYETQIFATGAVPTRPGNLHDGFNALVWLTFPHTKAALNARHVAAQRVAAKSSHRTPAQDALTLFDECGVIVASDRQDLLALIAGFEWKQLFWRRRGELNRHMKFFLFGHGLMEQLLNPYVGLTGKALLITVESAWLEASPDVACSYIDATCRALIASAGALSRSRDLMPLPVLGIPGWAPENGAEAYYDNVQYFRPGRRVSAKRIG
ncbi:MAG: DUF3025 domain-containing protein [Pseudomonadota bacterium]|nr:DUF3025 domain-containing protein [Pseudomonadota bacterium]